MQRDPHLSPARAAGLYMGTRSTRLTRKQISPFNCGDMVHDKADPRHVGRVMRVDLIGRTCGDVTVRFEDGTLAVIPFANVVRA